MPRTEVVHVLLQFADGTIGAMQFITGVYRLSDSQPVYTNEPAPENIQAEIDKMQTRDPATGNLALPEEKCPITSWRFCAPDEYPQDRTFRDAWRDQNGKIVHDMKHAREIKRMHLRRDRQPLLEALDVEYQRADEKAGAVAQREKNRIIERKQKLRDAPDDPRIEAAQTIDELKAITLEGS